MEKERLFITVIGKDCKGIVAAISNHLYRANINILDINMKLMEEYFVMTMLVDVVAAKKPLEQLRMETEALGARMGLRIMMQHENVFSAMHRV